ncbi:MAG: PAS domain-containing sensor histidine kinase [Euryarchaeota archaeon]|nr:PAS domain-containing sensor histidine kinase [Euryarchaeota archaeon]
MSDVPDIINELRAEERQGLLNGGSGGLCHQIETSNTVLQRGINKNVILRSELLSSLLKNIPDSIYFKDKDGRFIEVSDAKIQHLNTDRESILGKTDFDFYSQKEAEKMCIDEKYVMERGEVIQKEEKITRPNGEIAWVSVVKTPRHDNQGNVVGIIGISRDVTNQKKYEIALHESEEKYRTIFENSAIAIMTTDEHENILSWNSYTEKLLGLNREDLFMKPVHTLYPPTEWEKIRAQDIRQKGMQHHLETKIIKKNDKLIDVDISLSVLKNHEGKVIGSIGVISDITENKIKDEKLKEAQQILIMVNKALEEKVKERTKEIENLLKQKDEFIYQLGHDLKTPLTPLNSLLPVVRKKEQNEESKKYLDLAIKNVEYMKNLVQKTLKLASLNSTSFKLDLEVINCWQIIENVIGNMSSMLDGKNIEIKNLVKKDTFIKVDKLRFEELIDNMINNAVKFSYDEGKIEIKSETEHNIIKFSIADNGCGISKEESEKIFDEFYKADKSRHDVNSSGLGLSICKKIVEKHDGHIWAESAGLGKGSTFYFTFRITENEGKK